MTTQCTPSFIACYFGTDARIAFTKTGATVLNYSDSSVKEYKVTRSHLPDAVADTDLFAETIQSLLDQGLAPVIKPNVVTFTSQVHQIPLCPEEVRQLFKNDEISERLRADFYENAKNQDREHALLCLDMLARRTERTTRFVEWHADCLAYYKQPEAAGHYLELFDKTLRPNLIAKALVANPACCEEGESFGNKVACIESKELQASLFLMASQFYPKKTEMYYILAYNRDQRVETCKNSLQTRAPSKKSVRDESIVPSRTPSPSLVGMKVSSRAHFGSWATCSLADAPYVAAYADLTGVYRFTKEKVEFHPTGESYPLDIPAAAALPAHCGLSRTKTIRWLLANGYRPLLQGDKMTFLRTERSFDVPLPDESRQYIKIEQHALALAAFDKVFQENQKSMGLESYADGLRFFKCKKATQLYIELAKTAQSRAFHYLEKALENASLRDDFLASIRWLDKHLDANRSGLYMLAYLYFLDKDPKTAGHYYQQASTLNVPPLTLRTVSEEPVHGLETLEQRVQQELEALVERGIVCNTIADAFFDDCLGSDAKSRQQARYKKLGQHISINYLQKINALYSELTRACSALDKIVEESSLKELKEAIDILLEKGAYRIAEAVIARAIARAKADMPWKVASLLKRQAVVYAQLGKTLEAHMAKLTI